MAAKPLADANNLFRELGNDLPESLVNGIWIQVLKRLFPHPEFIIAPEHWTDSRRPGGSRVDLVVYRVQQRAPVFVYEGKADMEDLSISSDETLEAVLSAGLYSNLNQIKRYLDTLPRAQGETSYGVLAQGTQFIIMSYDGTQFHRVVHSSLSVDEKFNVFRDFGAARFNLDEANKILETIAAKYR